MKIKACCPLYQDKKKLEDDQKNWAKMEILGIMRSKKYGVSAKSTHKCNKE
jgi:hypothetical protein